MKDSFWAGGSGAYQKAIRENYLTQIKKLESQLKHCDDELERSALQEELQRIEAEYKEKCDGSGRLIF